MRKVKLFNIPIFGIVVNRIMNEVLTYLIVIFLFFGGVLMCGSVRAEIISNIDLNESLILFYDDFSNNESLKYITLNEMFSGGSNENVTYEIVNSTLHVHLGSAVSARLIEIKGLVPLPASKIKIGISGGVKPIHIQVYYGSFRGRALKNDAYFKSSDKWSYFYIQNETGNYEFYCLDISKRYEKNNITFDTLEFIINPNHTITVYGNGDYLTTVGLIYDGEMYTYCYPRYIIFREDVPSNPVPDYYIGYIEQSIDRSLITPTISKLIGITFDGPYISVYTNATALMEPYNYTSTIAISEYAISTSGFATWPQVNELKDTGWTIGMHTKDLIDPPGRTWQKELEYEYNEIYNKTGIYPKEWIALAGKENFTHIKYAYQNLSIVDRQLLLGPIVPYLFDNQYYKIESFFLLQMSQLL
jgi:hypothetical protein